MVRDCELAPDDFGDAGARPDLAAEAVRLGPVRQELRDEAQLPGREPRHRALVGAGQQAGLPVLAHGRHPLADGDFGDAEGVGDLLLPPAAALEFERAPAAHLFPVGCAGCVRRHARTFSTRARVKLSMHRSVILSTIANVLPTS